MSARCVHSLRCQFWKPRVSQLSKWRERTTFTARIPQFRPNSLHKRWLSGAGPPSRNLAASLSEFPQDPRGKFPRISKNRERFTERRFGIREGNSKIEGRFAFHRHRRRLSRFQRTKVRVSRREGTKKISGSISRLHLTAQRKEGRFHWISLLYVQFDYCSLHALFRAFI